MYGQTQGFKGRTSTPLSIRQMNFCEHITNTTAGQIVRTVEAVCDSVWDMVHYMNVMQRFRHTLLNPAWICFLWVGLTVGISMIATPMRFTAETVTRTIALDVGQVVFAALNEAELLALVILLIIVRTSGQATKYWGFCGALTLIVIAQSAWLTPELAERTQIIINGIEPPPSYTHAIYSSLELIKIGLLLFLGFSSIAASGSNGRTGST